MAIHQRDDGFDGYGAAETVSDRTVDDALMALATALHSMSTTVPHVVRPELEAILRTGIVPDDEVGADLPASRPSRKPRRTLTAVSAFVAMAAASVGGAHAAGVVDVPGLPDRPPAAEEVDAPAGDDGADQAVTRPDDAGKPDQTSNDRAEEVRPDDNDRSDPEGGSPTGPGVDGDDISDRATSGEPKERGRDFGQDVSEDAREGTPGEDRGARNEANDNRPGDDPGKPDAPHGSEKRDAEASEPGTPDVADGTTDGPPSGRP